MKRNRTVIFKWFIAVILEQRMPYVGSRDISDYSSRGSFLDCDKEGHGRDRYGILHRVF